MMKQEQDALYESIQQALQESEFLHAAGLDRQAMQQLMQTLLLPEKAAALWTCRNADGW